ncbi:MAG: hypothetical protein CVU87_08955 [Firmicutes bacterium HGW-Firmicutes-12]|nr:MAG: hypothetical protein CVU87_08955 [Firmicutes bacterium HGW-Firmicutes-12]
MAKVKALSEDRLIGGALAGAVGGIIQNLYGVTVKVLGLTDRAFIDFAVVTATFKVHKILLYKDNRLRFIPMVYYIVGRYCIRITII